MARGWGILRPIVENPFFDGKKDGIENGSCKLMKIKWLWVEVWVWRGWLAWHLGDWWVSLATKLWGAMRSSCRRRVSGPLLWVILILFLCFRRDGLVFYLEQRTIVHLCSTLHGCEAMGASCSAAGNISFDLATELLRFRHIRVMFPYLPLLLWNHEALTAIGNYLGRFIHL